MKVRLKKLSPEAVMPTKAYDDDFCYDCHAVMQMVKDQINQFAKEHNIDYQV